MLTAARALRRAAPFLGRGRSTLTAAAEAEAVPASTAAAGDRAAAHLTSRYAALVACGALQPDEQQQRLVSHLAALLQQLDAHAQAVAAHREARREYEERYQQRLSELEQLERQQQQQQQPASAAAAVHAGSSSQPSGGSWLGGLLSRLRAQPQPQPAPSPAQLARQAAAARAARVTAELGPGPQPPSPPQGLYIYGSVGSGKTLLMDLFCDASRTHLATPRGQRLDHVRRLHYSAAMQEFNSRLHQLELKRQQRRQQEQAAAVAAAEHSEAPEGPVDGCESSDEDSRVAAWFDDSVLRQKEAKAAVLAIRRHLRAARAGRVPPAHLAAANATVMAQAARSLLRADGPDPTAGWAGQGGGQLLSALLCFDELQVGDVFSAAALKALLEVLTAEGTTVVLTSNRHPADLPRHGLHESMFAHFQATLFESCRLFELSAPIDYRRLAAGAAAQLLQQPLLSVPSGSSSSHAGATYFWGPAAEQALLQRWAQTVAAVGHASASVSSASSAASATSATSANPLQLSASASVGQVPCAGRARASDCGGGSVVVPVLFGRSLHVRRCAGGAAYFGFDELCGAPLGPADYLAVCQNFHTVFLEGVPVMCLSNRDKARRFIALIDEAYHCRTQLHMSAAAPPDKLFAATEGEVPLLDLEALQFEGAVEGSKLRRNLLADGGVAPVASSPAAAAEAAVRLGGEEELFAWARAVSRLYEMQSPLFAAARCRVDAPAGPAAVPVAG